MTCRIEHESPSALPDYARVSRAFEVRETLEARTINAGIEGLELRACPARPPHVKDYDAIDGNHPTEWPWRFDMREWAIIAARDGSRRRRRT